MRPGTEGELVFGHRSREEASFFPSRISPLSSPRGHYPTIDHTRALERNPSLESQTRTSSSGILPLSASPPSFLPLVQRLPLPLGTISSFPREFYFLTQCDGKRFARQGRKENGKMFEKFDRTEQVIEFSIQSF